jgi:transcriptional regulator with PAS, ATPase and Fis domain
MPEEDAILQELQRTGKEEPADRLDCGACGYSTCRDKAIAVLQGMAERQMCLPYMRKLAEQRTDRIIETSPNGIVILDEHLRILNMNPAFRKMFVCSEAMLGKRISTLMDPTGFERLATGRTQRSEGLVRHEKYSLLCHQILYVLPEEKQLVGIFVNVTQNRRDKDQLDKLRTQTMNQARELLEHQVSTARQMARLLGEGTAKGEGLLEKLMEFTGDAEAGGDFLPEQPKQPSPPASRKRDWKWTTST